ncbi:hypothetical protein EXM36_10350 [Clostridium botulinum]|nr:hypothetical protein [Clostridium botulinum]NCI34149.1 hypothetical protein [Clostridium botulinum]NCI71252.1 hypothetical protein [Clostridium botulinum]NDI38503.1 hypothetical protein [Clostridium botulinum]NEZ71102.1 hypothetical protein [Clostridium botulinum]
MHVNAIEWFVSMLAKISFSIIYIESHIDNLCGFFDFQILFICTF